MKKEEPRTQQPTAAQNFTDGLRRALSVPKAEIDKREEEWREKRKSTESTRKRHD